MRLPLHTHYISRKGFQVFFLFFFSSEKENEISCQYFKKTTRHPIVKTLL